MHGKKGSIGLLLRIAGGCRTLEEWASNREAFQSLLIWGNHVPANRHGPLWCPHYSCSSRGLCETTNSNPASPLFPACLFLLPKSHKCGTKLMAFRHGAVVVLRGRMCSSGASLLRKHSISALHFSLLPHPQHNNGRAALFMKLSSLILCVWVSDQ